MKHLYLIGGAMGAGKTTVSTQLMKLLPDSVFLDGDWCWSSDPFQVTDETKAMVTDNICHLLNNFLHCSAYCNVIFCWVMHQQPIIDDILSRLDTSGASVSCISLTCSPEQLKSQLTADIDAGIRTPDVIERSLARLPLYDALDTVKIVTDGLSPVQVAEKIASL